MHFNQINWVKHVLLFTILIILSEEQETAFMDISGSSVCCVRALAVACYKFTSFKNKEFDLPVTVPQEVLF